MLQNVMDDPDDRFLPQMNQIWKVPQASYSPARESGVLAITDVWYTILAMAYHPGYCKNSKPGSHFSCCQDRPQGSPVPPKDFTKRKFKAENVLINKVRL